jgi:hypothetical protein
MVERWVDVDGYDGMYQVSDIGRVRSRRKVLLPYERHGYLYVRLSKDGVAKNYRVHRLVAKAFVDNPNDYIEVNHLDGDKQNNRHENLKWCTGSQNITHAYDLGLLRKPTGELNGNHKLSSANVREIKRLCSLNYSVREISELFGVSVTTVRYIRQGKTWSNI